MRRRSAYVLAALALVLAPLPAVELLGTSQASDDLLEQVTIVRDGFGVPHLYADSADALWYANGYVQAQDRLWAMDLLRHLGYGEGASVVGPGGGILEMDMNTRRNLYDRAELQGMLDQAREENPAFVQVVERFSEGVNRAAAEMTAAGELPAEFEALQHGFEPWRPIDTISVATFLLAEFGNGGGAEISNAKLLAQLETALGDEAGQAAFQDLNWVSHPDAYATVQESRYDEPRQLDALAWEDVPEAQQEATRAAAEARTFGLDGEAAIPRDTGFFAGQSLDFKLGSNALLVAPSHSETGEALVGGGPQMGYFNPQVPYEVGLHLADGSIDAEGMGVTGAPGVIIGRVANFAWTVTSGISDQTDTIALEAAGERAYHWDGDVLELDCTEEVHRLFTPPGLVDPEEPEAPVNVVTQEVCDSHLGPVVAITGPDEAPEWFFTQRTTSRFLEIPSAISWLSVTMADDLADFQAIFEDFAFTFNFHYAGVGHDGTGETVCYHHVGLQPVRNSALDPRFP
ncbi:MAG: penicillin acylase family protein, partial [Candidatus Thermoplasmatota archaeon]|nr:penicillin acylase family protein [Candidatus Thermoplasmatota archaeon]